MPTTEIQAQFRSLAGATVPHGTGRVYLFNDSVRVPCQQLHTFIEEGDGALKPTTAYMTSCKYVGCPGWVPSKDLGVLGQAFWTAMTLRRQFTRHRQLSVCWALYLGTEAVLGAMLEAVQTIEGVTLG